MPRIKEQKPRKVYIDKSKIVRSRHDDTSALFYELDQLMNRETDEQREERLRLANIELDKRFEEIRRNPLTQKDPKTGKFPFKIIYGFPLGQGVELEPWQVAQREREREAGQGNGQGGRAAVATMPPPNQSRHSKMAMKRK